MNPISTPSNDELSNLIYGTHGTRLDKAKDICRTGFDFARPGRHGSGIYLWTHMNDDETRRTAIGYARIWALRKVERGSDFDEGQPGILDVQADIDDGKVLDICARDVFPYFQAFVDTSLSKLKRAHRVEHADVSKLYGVFRTMWEKKALVTFDAFHVLTQKPTARDAIKYPCFGLQCDASCYVVFDPTKLSPTLITA